VKLVPMISSLLLMAHINSSLRSHMIT